MGHVFLSVYHGPRNRAPATHPSPQGGGGSHPSRGREGDGGRPGVFLGITAKRLPTTTTATTRREGFGVAVQRRTRYREHLRQMRVRGQGKHHRHLSADKVKAEGGAGNRAPGGPHGSAMASPFQGLGSPFKGLGSPLKGLVKVKVKADREGWGGESG